MKNNTLLTANIDKTDINILALLHQNSRIPLTEIGAKVDLSKDGVLYRINKLVEKGIIKKFFIDVDYKLLNFSKYILFIRFSDISPQKLEEISAQIQNIHEIIFSASCIGYWDIWLEILADSFARFNEVMDQIFGRFGTNIKDYHLLVISEEHKLYDPLLESEDYGILSIPQKEKKPRYKKQEFEQLSNTPLKINVIDYKILKSLENDSRKSYVDIAKETGIALDTVKYRVKKLVETKLIMHFDLVLDYNKLGHNLDVVLFKFSKYTKDVSAKFISYLNANKNVRAAVSVIGKQEIMAEVLTHNREEYLNFINQIRSQFSDIFSGYTEIRVVSDIKDVTLPYIKL
jgi:DNA-binding Lrp family transcriptional regulator